MSYRYFLSEYSFVNIKALKNINVFAKDILAINNLLTKSWLINILWIAVTKNHIRLLIF